MNPVLARTEEPRWTWVGGRSATIRLGGHSHMLAFRYAMKLLDEREQRRVAVLDLKKGYHAPTDDYWTRLSEAETKTAVVFGGNDHNVSFLFNDKPVTIVGRHAAAAPSAVGTVIPYRMVMELWRTPLAGLMRFMSEHRDPGSVVVVGTPPPKPDAQIRAGIAIEPHFVGLLTAAGTSAEAAPLIDPATRVATWEAYQDVMEEIAVATGGRFMPVPDQVRTDEGTLKPEYCDADATHANKDYGVLMWRSLIDFVDGK